LQPEHISVGNLFAGEWTYTVPLFQRPYVWDKARWEPLWEDVVRVVEEARRGTPKVRPHFLGSVVLQQSQTKITEGPRREVIDGQQRLTTLQLLLKAVADVLENDETTADAGRPLRRLLRNADAPPADKVAAFKVWPTNVDRVRFCGVMLGDGEARPENGNRFAAAYSFFRQEVQLWLDDAGDDKLARVARGQALSATLRQRLQLIALNLTADDQAQVIFETLNARGTPLLPADLIKNLLLRRAEEEGDDAAALYQAYWHKFDADEAYWRRQVGRGHTARPRVDLFLVQFLSAKTHGIISAGQLYESFADWLADGGKDRKTVEHMEEVARFSGIYRLLDDANDADGDRVATCAARLRAMDFTTAMPVLLYLCADSGHEATDIAEAATWIESFLVRRMVCGLNTRGYGTLFADLLGSIADVGREASAAHVVANFLLRSEMENALWPDDGAFAQAWRSQPIYSTLRRDRLAMMLRALEGALRSPKHDPVPIPRTLHVEHLLPRNWRVRWPLPEGAGPDAALVRDAALHTIGNLTLLTAKLNQSLSDAPWNEKRPALQEYGLMALNGALARQDTWNEAAICERSEKLLLKALTVWPRPNRDACVQSTAGQL
jgi:hypothetical protein